MQAPGVLAASWGGWRCVQLAYLCATHSARPKLLHDTSKNHYKPPSEVEVAHRHSPPCAIPQGVSGNSVFWVTLGQQKLKAIVKVRARAQLRSISTHVCCRQPSRTINTHVGMHPGRPGWLELCAGALHHRNTPVSGIRRAPLQPCVGKLMQVTPTPHCLRGTLRSIRRRIPAPCCAAGGLHARK